MKHKYVVELYMLNSLDKKAQQETDHQEYNKKLEIPKLYLSEIWALNLLKKAWEHFLLNVEMLQELELQWEMMEEAKVLPMLILVINLKLLRPLLKKMDLI